MTLETGRLDALFGALADPTRRALVARLAQGEASVGELAAPFAISLPAISKHLGVLEDAGLVRRERDGRSQRCRLDAAPIREAAAWLARYQTFWTQQLDALEEEMRSWPKREPPPRTRARRKRRSVSAAASPRRRRTSSTRGRRRKP